MQRATHKHGVPKVHLRSSVPISTRKQLGLIQQAYSKRHGFEPSVSLLISIATKLLHDSVCRGRLPHHADLWLSKPIAPPSAGAKAEGLPVGEGEGLPVGEGAST